MTGMIETEHQGIQTVLAKRTGPTISAGLVFRVGRADETLATTGITHLVEHLALHQHGLGDLHFNGQTDDSFTHFHVQGSEAEVVGYLNGVCAALNDLPMARLETEKQILRTEAGGRGSGPAPMMALLRYGAQGFGLSSYDEIGLPNADPESVRAWVAQCFTRQNAVLWITSDRVPDGLNLPLREGTRRAMPVVTSALPQTPAWQVGQNNLTCLQSVIPRSTAGSLFAGVLGRRLFRELRQEGGLCYTATADYIPRDHQAAVVWAVADADPDKREAVVGGFIDVLAALRLGAVDQADLDAVRTKVLRQFDEPDLAAMRLPGHAMNLLSGHQNLSDPELIAELQETTVEDLQYIAEQVWANALFQVPALGLDWAGVDQAPQHSSSSVHGQEFVSLENDGSAIVVGSEGVSLTHQHGRSTVRFQDSVAMLVWPDGARRLFARDGFYVHVEPTIHPVDERAVAQIDTAVPGHLVVRMPPRDPEHIPQPAARPAPVRNDRARRAERPAVRFGWNLFAWVMSALGALFLVSSVVGLTEMQPETRGDDIGTAVTGAIMGIGFLALAWWSRRKALTS